MKTGLTIVSAQENKDPFPTDLCKCNNLIFSKWDDKPALLVKNTNIVLQLCLNTFKLYLKCSVDIYYIFSKLVLIQDLLVEMDQLKKFYNELFDHIDSKDREIFAEIESQKRFNSNQIRDVINSNLKMNKAYLIIVLNFFCFFQHSEDSLEWIRDFVLCNLIKIEQKINKILSIMPIGAGFQSINKTSKFIITAIDLIKDIEKYFVLLELKSINKCPSNIKEKTEVSLIEKINSFDLEKESNHNEFFYWVQTYIGLYFFEKLSYSSNVIKSIKDFRLNHFDLINKMIKTTYESFSVKIKNNYL